MANTDSTNALVLGENFNDSSEGHSSIATIEEQEEEELEGDDDHPTKHQAPNTVLVDTINDIKLRSREHWRKSSELQDCGSLCICADEGLAYLIRLCGFKGLENIVHKKRIMSEGFFL